MLRRVESGQRRTREERCGEEEGADAARGRASDTSPAEKGRWLNEGAAPSAPLPKGWVLVHPPW